MYNMWGWTKPERVCVCCEVIEFVKLDNKSGLYSIKFIYFEMNALQLVPDGMFDPMRTSTMAVHNRAPPICGMAPLPNNVTVICCNLPFSRTCQSRVRAASSTWTVDVTAPIHSDSCNAELISRQLDDCWHSLRHPRSRQGRHTAI